MRIAVITDIHGNYKALSKAFEIIDSSNVDKTICLGDIIGKGPDSILSLEAIMSRNIETVTGNWELYVKRGPENFRIDISEYESFLEICNSMTNEQKNWINNLPFEIKLQIKGKRLLFMHFIVENVNRTYPFYMLRTLENGRFQKVISKYKYDYMFFGHRHTERYIKNSMIVPSLGLLDNKFLILDINDDLITRNVIKIDI